MRQLLVDDLTIDITRKKIKNLHLVICRFTGKVRISAPHQMKDDTLRTFVTSKLSWIKKHKTKPEGQKLPSAHKYVSGESHYFFGKPYLLNVIDSNKNQVVLCDNTHIDLFISQNSTTHQRKKIMIEWYKKQLKEKMLPLIKKWHDIMNLEASHYSIRQMKTRWGSCNIKSKRISINLALIKKPEHCLEYIIVHELVHLLERLHNANFKAHMDRFMPDWRNYRDELNRIS